MDAEQKIAVGRAWLDPETCRLYGPDAECHLEPRVVELCVRLGQHQGSVVSRNDLIEAIWHDRPGADHALTTAVSRLRHALKRTGADPGVIETVPKRGYRLKAPDRENRTESSRAHIGLAIAPFRNLTGSQADQHLCEGLAEELANFMTGVDELRVAARTSSFSLARMQASLADFRVRLNVDYLLDGSVQRFEDRLRINVNLVELASETLVWSRDFEHQPGDLLELQRSIVNTVLQAVLNHLGIASRGVGWQPPRSNNSDALNSFLKGQYFWHRENVNPGKAFKYFHEAVSLDPDFAAPYAGLVDCYCTYGVWQLMPQSKAREHALSCAEQAMALAPGSADVQFSHGYAQFYARWRWPIAERSMRRALQITPDHVLSHCFLGMLLAVLDQDSESRQLARRASEIDPLSPFCWNMRALTSYYLRDYKLAADCAREALELQPDDLFSLWLRAASLAHSGDHERGKKFAEQLETNAGSTDLFLGCAVATYAVCGARQEAELAMRELLRRHEKRGVSPLVFSIAYAALGQERKAIQALQGAYDEKNMAIFYIARDPYVDPIRQHAEFKKLLADLELNSAG